MSSIWNCSSTKIQVLYDKTLILKSVWTNWKLPEPNFKMLWQNPKTQCISNCSLAFLDVSQCRQCPKSFIKRLRLISHKGFNGCRQVTKVLFSQMHEHVTCNRSLVFPNNSYNSFYLLINLSGVIAIVRSVDTNDGKNRL